jgi:hypothetical protein
VSLESDAGNVPVKEFSYRKSALKEVISPTSEGIALDRELVYTKRYSSAVNAPYSDGRVP